MILWTDVSDTPAEQLYHTVEQRNVKSLLSGSQNEAIFHQLKEVGARADLLKYEVLPPDSCQVTFYVPGCFPIWRHLP